MASTSNKDIVTEILPFIRIYKDGTVERLTESPFVPPSPYDNHHPETGVPVTSKDISISLQPLIGARLFLPLLPNTLNNNKLPILVYFHGGGFCFESAFSADHHQFLNSLVSEAKIIAVSVEYRLAPEHHLPIAYEDCWTALQWVVSLSTNDHHGTSEEPWLTDYGDFERVFLGGDSAGANIVHNIAMRIGKEGLCNGMKAVSGAFLTHPYFWGSSEDEGGDNGEISLAHVIWNFVYPSAPGGVDNPMMNPVAAGSPSLAGIGCSRLLVSVAEKDFLRKRGIGYYEAVKESGWNGEIELVDVKGEDHAFQILHWNTQNSKNLIKRLAHFLQN
ncbi:2-hydroxyisoflavanone dehydratase [Cannabis sativa]|uniref:2-hydroxyisoflavanone dehydratase n=1 Tax=Cannabis sativa TaxID=3483 RepID=UPI0029CA319F|nr:2-hydroxyisoflavanone dehydratase [Cannabis sativa]